MSARRDGRTKRSLFFTDQEWLKLKAVAAAEGMKRGESVSTSQIVHIMIDERLEES